MILVFFDGEQWVVEYGGEIVAFAITEAEANVIADDLSGMSEGVIALSS